MNVRMVLVANGPTDDYLYDILGDLLRERWRPTRTSSSTTKPLRCSPLPTRGRAARWSKWKGMRSP
jgi:hypothetical protein